MKRILAILLALMMIGTLAACGASSQEKTSSETVAEKTAETTAETTAAAGTEATAQETTAAETEFTTEAAEFFRDGLKISGEFLLPESETPQPLVILSHGFGGNRYTVMEYAEAFAKNGIASLVFDFVGGGTSIQSDGETTDMSVLTEAADLNAILDKVKADPRFDKSNIFLFGESQGGLVSTYVACEHAQDVAGLAVLYPAYVLRDRVEQEVPDPDNIPDTMSMLGVTVGSVYARDLLSFDIYDMMKDYGKKVLIVHGTHDSLVPIAYSERAVGTFPDAELIRLENADHGFSGEDKETASQKAVAYVQSMIQ